MRRRLLVGLVAVTLAGGLAGCVSLPDSSSVSTGQGAGVPLGQSQVRYSPPGPQPEATRAEVIQGYLRAMLAYPSDPAVVREFMTGAAAASWRPHEEIRVYQGPAVQGRPHGQWQLTGQLLGTVDERGSWDQAVGKVTDLAVPLTMVRESGGWRIANPAPGMLMNAAHFAAYFHEFSLYFFAPLYTLIAPDPVYLENGPPAATATALVRNLLLGPTDEMARVARSAALPRTRLTGPVTVSANGLATVTLTPNMYTLEASRLNSLARQLAFTLGQARLGISTMTIKGGGRALRVHRGSVFSLDEFRDPTLNAGSQTLYALNERGRLLRVPARGTPQAVTGPITQGDIAARSVSVNAANSCAAIVSKDGTMVRSGALTGVASDETCGTFHHRGTNLLRPSWDASGLLWLVDLVDGKAELLVALGDKTYPVPASGLAGLDVTAFAVSRDGMRLAAVIGRGRTSRLVVGLIHRVAAPRRLTELELVDLRPIVSEPPLTDIYGLAWANGTTVAVLARDAAGAAQPYQVSIDGSRVVPIPGTLPPGRPVSIAAGPDSGAPIVIGTSEDLLYAHESENHWGSPLTTLKLTAPAYPG